VFEFGTLVLITGGITHASPSIWTIFLNKVREIYANERERKHFKGKKLGHKLPTS
jgi:hypothetical protein